MLWYLPSHLTNAEIASECLMSVNAVKESPDSPGRFINHFLTVQLLRFCLTVVSNWSDC